MNPSKRVLILGIVIEICLAAFWAYLLLQLKTGGLHAATSTEDAVSTISSTLGGVMGALGVARGCGWSISVPQTDNGEIASVSTG